MPLKTYSHGLLVNCLRLSLVGPNTVMVRVIRKDVACFELNL